MTRRRSIDSSVNHLLQRQYRNLDQEVQHVSEEIDNLIDHWSREFQADLSLDELAKSVALFRRFAVVYVDAIWVLTDFDHHSVAEALRKIQSEIFVLRRLVEQRWSPNLYLALRVADHWATSYLSELLKQGAEPRHPQPAPSPPPPTAEKVHPKITRRPVANQPISYKQGDIEGQGAHAVVADGNRDLAPRDELRNKCLTFLELSHHIKLSTLSYNRNPSIGLPLMHAHEPWHWLGIAHEIGHFIFRNCNLDEVPLDHAVRHKIFSDLTATYQENAVQRAPFLGDQGCLGIAQSIPLWCRWAEELFADCMGAVTLGSAYIESLIMWMAPKIKDAHTLLVNDEDHPIACLRPLFQLFVLLDRLELDGHDTKGALQDELADLAQHWIDFCEERFRAAGLLPKVSSVAADTAQYDLTTMAGIISRIAPWKQIRHHKGGLSIGLLLEQAPVVAHSCAQSLTWATPYTVEHHRRATQLAAKPRQFSDETVFDLLIVLWYRQKTTRVVEHRSLLKSIWQNLPQIPAPVDDPGGDAREGGDSAEGTDETFTTFRNSIDIAMRHRLLEPLLNRDPRWGERSTVTGKILGLQIIDDCRPGHTHPDAHDLSRWLLRLEFSGDEQAWKHSCDSDETEVAVKYDCR